MTSEGLATRAEKRTEKRDGLVVRRWRLLLIATFLITLVNTWIAISIRQSNAASHVHMFVLLSLGALGQVWLFNHRFFSRLEERAAYSARRQVLLLGIPLYENLRFSDFKERAGAAFIFRLVVAILVATVPIQLEARGILSLQHGGLAIWVEALALALCLYPIHFWNALWVSAGYLAIVAHIVWGPNDLKTLACFASVGAEVLFFHWLQGVLAEQTRFLDQPSRVKRELTHRQWLVPVLTFLVLSALAYPLMRGPYQPKVQVPNTRHVPPKLDRQSASNRQGRSGKSPSSDGQEPSGGGGGGGGGSGGQAYGNKSGGVPGMGLGGLPAMNGPGKGTGNGKAGSDQPSDAQGGQGAQTGAGSEGRGTGGNGQGNGDGAGQGNAGNGGNPSGGAGSERTPGPGTPSFDKHMPQMPKFTPPKLPEIPPDLLKKMVPYLIVVLMLLLFALWPRRKKDREKAISKRPALPPGLPLTQVMKEFVDEKPSLEAVIKLYHAFLRFLAERESPKPDPATPDEYAGWLGRQFDWNGPEINRISQTFCRAYYGRMAPSAPVFQTYLSDLGRVQKDLGNPASKPAS